MDKFEHDAKTRREVDSFKYDKGQTSDEIKENIDRTRSSIRRDIDDLEERVNPDRIQAETERKVKEMGETVSETVTETINETADVIGEELGATVSEKIKELPWPVTLLIGGAGFFLLKLAQDRRSRSQFSHPLPESGKDRNKLFTGLIAAGAGAATVGLALRFWPSSDDGYEDDWGGSGLDDLPESHSPVINPEDRQTRPSRPAGGPGPVSAGPTGSVIEGPNTVEDLNDSSNEERDSSDLIDASGKRFNPDHK